MIKMIEISRFIANTLNESQEFKDYVDSLISDEFNYFINVDERRNKIPTPYVTISTFEMDDNKEETEARLVSNVFNKTLVKITIDKLDPEMDGNITEEPTDGILENITIKAIDVITKEIRTFGINGDKNIELDSENYYVPISDGEDDSQLQISLLYRQLRFLK